MRVDLESMRVLRARGLSVTLPGGEAPAERDDAERLRRICVPGRCCMRRKERERTDRAFMEQVLKDADTLWLSLNTEGAPYVIPVNHALHEGVLYIHCANEGLKLDLIRRDPRVGFAAATDVRIIRERSTTAYRSVCGSGTAVIVEDEAEKQTALVAIRDQYQAICDLPAPASRLPQIGIVRIVIESLTGTEKTLPA